MDLVEFTTDTIKAIKGNKTQCVVIVTPTDEENFTLMLEILGKEGFFITPNGTSNKSIRTFKSNGFMEPRRCEMDLLMGSKKDGDYTTVLTAYTANSDKPKVKLILVDAGILEDHVPTDSTDSTDDLTLEGEVLDADVAADGNQIVIIETETVNLNITIDGSQHAEEE